MRAWVMEVKARRPDTARMTRMSQSDQQIFTKSEERMRTTRLQLREANGDDKSRDG